MVNYFCRWIKTNSLQKQHVVHGEFCILQQIKTILTDSIIRHQSNVVILELETGYQRLLRWLVAIRAIWCELLLVFFLYVWQISVVCYCRKRQAHKGNVIFPSGGRRAPALVIGNGKCSCIVSMSSWTYVGIKWLVFWVKSVVFLLQCRERHCTAHSEFNRLINAGCTLYRVSICLKKKKIKIKRRTIDWLLRYYCTENLMLLHPRTLMKSEL